MTSTTLSPGRTGELHDIKPWRIVLDSYELLLAKGAALLRAIWLPTIFMSASVLLALKTYFVCLASYSTTHSVRVASIAVSSFVVGVILSALTSSIASANVARVIRRGSADLRLRGMDARIFAAVLRLLTVGVVGFAFVGGIVALAQQYLAPILDRYVVWSGWGVAALFLTALSARCGFLAPALAAADGRRVLRRGWVLSGAHFWPVIVTWLMLTVVPVTVLQGLGELLVMRLVAPSMITLAQGAATFATDNLALLGIAGSLVLTAIAGTVLTTIGSFALVERLR